MAYTSTNIKSSAISGYNPPAIATPIRGYLPPGKNTQPTLDPVTRTWSVESLGSSGSSFINNSLGLTGVGSIAAIGGGLIADWSVKFADWLNNGGTTRALEEMRKEQFKPSSVPAPATAVTLPTSISDPYASSEFKFKGENVPPLLEGVMQSAEVVALALGSLTQITADNHAEHMQYYTSDMIIRYEHGERVASSLETLVPLLIGIVETMNLPDTQNAILANGNAIASAVANQQPASAQAINNVDVSPIVEAMKQSDNAFKQTYIPSGEFWGKADSATIKYNRFTGTSALFDYLPSSTELIPEVTMISAMVANGDNQSEIIKAIESSRKNSLGSAVYALTMYGDDVFNSQDDLNQSMKNYYDNALNTKVPEATVAMSQSLADIAQWSQKAKDREVFLQTSQSFRDSDNDVLVEASPMEISANKDAQHYKNLDDKNTEKYEESDFNNPLDMVPLVPFIGREDVFNPAHVTPTQNPFLDRLKSLLPNWF